MALLRSGKLLSERLELLVELSAVTLARFLFGKKVLPVVARMLLSDARGLAVAHNDLWSPLALRRRRAARSRGAGRSRTPTGGRDGDLARKLGSFELDLEHGHDKPRLVVDVARLDAEHAAAGDAANPVVDFDQILGLLDRDADPGPVAAQVLAGNFHPALGVVFDRLADLVDGYFPTNGLLRCCFSHLPSPASYSHRSDCLR